MARWGRRPGPRPKEGGRGGRRSRGRPALLLFFLLFSWLFSAPLAARPAPPQARFTPRQWTAVSRVLGVPGEIRGDVFRVDLASSAGAVWMHGIPLAPGAIDPSWVCFGQQGGLGWMMGRLLLPAPRAQSVVGRLAPKGIEVTGVVDPLPGSSPTLSAVYFRKVGDPVALARQLKSALGHLLQPPAKPTALRPQGLDVAAIDQVVGSKGALEPGALVFRMSRPEVVKCCGVDQDPLLVYSGIPLGPATGLESRIAFQAAGAGAVVVGRLAVRHEEVSLVEQALAIFGIETVGLSDLLANESPRILFLQFFGRGKPLELAQGIRAALERIRRPVTSLP